LSFSLFNICCGAAGGTASPVNIDSAAALGTCPESGFIPNELSDAMFLDVVQVFEHTHVVLRAVSLIQLLESFAGITFAGKAVIPASLVAIHDNALLTGFRFLGGLHPASRTVILHSKISHAYPAVHPAGCDQFLKEVGGVTHDRNLGQSKGAEILRHARPRMNEGLMELRGSG
jgi:hypothetical protein